MQYHNDSKFPTTTVNGLVVTLGSESTLIARTNSCSLPETKGALLIIGFLMLLLIGIQNSIADENNHGQESSKKRHAIGIFVGATHAEEEYLETLGIEYGYFASESVEVGAVVERAVREDNSTLVIAFVSFRPYKGWFVGAGIGRKDPGPDPENTLRLSFGYDFEVNHNWSVEPQFHWDIIENEENEEVLGIAVVRRF